MTTYTIAPNPYFSATPELFGHADRRQPRGLVADRRGDRSRAGWRVKVIKPGREQKGWPVTRMLVAVAMAIALPASADPRARSGEVTVSATVLPSCMVTDERVTCAGLSPSSDDLNITDGADEWTDTAADDAPTVRVVRDGGYVTILF